MSNSETIKLNIYYGGLMEWKDGKFSYRGGLLKKGLDIDPDFMTWSMFDSFCEENGVCGLVEQVWYKLPDEDMAAARPIYADKDAEIRQMCSEATKTGEVDLYIEQGLSQPSHSPLHPLLLLGADIVIDKGYENEGNENEGVENAVEEECTDNEEGEAGNCENANAEENDEGEELIEEGGDDQRFQTFFAEVNNEENLFATQGTNNHDGEANVRDDDVDNDAEFERQCRDADHPDPAVDTEDEWEAFNKEETDTSKKAHQNDKPPYLWLMQTFRSGDEFKEQLLRYVLKTNYDVKMCRWEQTKLGAICTQEKCEWKIYCSVEKSKRKWMVKMYRDTHNHLKTGKARMLKQGTIARLFKDEARRRPGLKWTDIKDELMIRYNISVSKWICIKARRLALDLVNETQQQQFSKLWDYESELRRSNPNTTTEIVTLPRPDGRKVFDKFYICFEALQKTWRRFCRPIIGLDGSFMKWEMKGEILAAVGRDADNRIYPIAWAIVRVEDNESWAWFVDKLKTDLQLGLGNGFTIISDKQKGLINAIANLIPNAEHRHCARHIFANWKKVYGRFEYEGFFWTVAYSHSMGEYEFNMDALKKFDQVAYEDLLKTEPKTWCRAFFNRDARCHDVCNNLSESFNRTIKEARKLPMINMLEEIRRLAMKRISARFDKTSKCLTKFPPSVLEVFENNRRDSKFCTVIKSSDTLYEVIELDGSYEVSLPYKHCACNQWDITGIPCRHAIHVIVEHNRDPEDFVDTYFLTSMWQDTYRCNIKPVNGEKLWKKTGKDPIEIPEKRRMPGRPKKYARMKEVHESSSNSTKVTRDGRSITCSNCKQIGHNMSTCNRAPVVVAGPKRKRGRPKKNNDDQWSIQNAPRRRRDFLSQMPTEPTSSTHSSNDPHPSTAPPMFPSAGRGRGTSRGSATGRGRAPSRGCAPSRGRGASRGRGRGRGRGVEPPIPRGYGCYISPWSGRVFDVWGSSAVDINGPSPRPLSGPSHPSPRAPSAGPSQPSPRAPSAGPPPLGPSQER